jgi:hypothetical protein
MSISDQRKRYEVARFVLDGAELDKVCDRLALEPKTAIAYWESVATELGTLLGADVHVQGTTVPAVFQDQIFVCLEYLVRAVQMEKQRETLGDVELPVRPTQIDDSLVTEMEDDAVLIDPDRRDETAYPPGVSQTRVDQDKSGPTRVDAMLPGLERGEPSEIEPTGRPEGK